MCGINILPLGTLPLLEAAADTKRLKDSRKVPAASTVPRYKERKKSREGGWGEEMVL